MGFITKLLLVYGMVLAASKGNEPGGCDTPQYLNVGRMGIINCSFTEHFYGVYWYNSLDSATTYPLLSFQESEKSGDGYISGQFDVLPNGSLVIKNVSFENDHMFRVILLKTKEDDSTIHDVRLYVTVRSSQPYPYIDVCGKEPFCFVKFSRHNIVACAVNGTRPGVDISWKVHNESGFWELPIQKSVLPDGNLFSTTAKISTDFELLSTIEHLVCTVVNPSNILAHDQSHLFLESTEKKYSSEESIKSNVQRGTRFSLNCSVKNQKYIIWKRKFSDDKWKTIAHVFFGDQVYAKTYSEYYSLDKSGSLVVPFAHIFNEGFHMCIYNEHSVKSFDVTVYVSPQPPYVIVEGCEADHQCSLKVSIEGNLTCSVHQIRPKINLELVPFPETSTKYITFFGHEEVVEKIGDTFNITLTSRYKLKDVTQSKVAVACRVSGWDESISYLDRTLELQFAIDGLPLSTFPVWTIALIVVLSAVIILLALLTVVMKRRKNKQQQDTASDDKDTLENGNKATATTPLVSEGQDSSAKNEDSSEPQQNASGKKYQHSLSSKISKNQEETDDQPAIDEHANKSQPTSQEKAIGDDNATGNNMPTNEKEKEEPEEGNTRAIIDIWENRNQKSSQK